MKRLLTLLIAGFLFLGVAEKQAAASSFDLGTVSAGDSKSGFVANFGSNITNFDDQISFSLVDLATSLVGSISDLTIFYAIPLNSLNFQLDLFNAVDPATSLGTYVDPVGTGIEFSYLNLAAGSYFLRVRGDTGALGNAYEYRIDFNAVPIPPALLLFATALGGMGLAAYRRRKVRA
ncbi:MAG: hypothetical protein IPK59_22190 [Rhodospirillaceae bacterium]|nr:hypothetical protein [Rhodospirillaceae bacterium]